MTVAAEKNDISAVCDGVSTSFPLADVIFYALDDIDVYIVDSVTGDPVGIEANAGKMVRGTDYEITGDPKIGDAAVVMAVAWGATYRFRARRNTPPLQQSDYPPDHDFDGKTFGQQLDRSMLVSQGVRSRTNRAVRAPAWENNLNAIPTEPRRKGKLALYQSDGHPGISETDADVFEAMVQWWITTGGTGVIGGGGLGVDVEISSVDGPIDADADFVLLSHGADSTHALASGDAGNKRYKYIYNGADFARTITGTFGGGVTEQTLGVVNEVLILRKMNGVYYVVTHGVPA